MECALWEDLEKTEEEKVWCLGQLRTDQEVLGRNYSMEGTSYHQENIHWLRSKEHVPIFLGKTYLQAS